MTGRNRQRMEWAIDYHGISPDVLVFVPSENAVIDPRGIGNAARKVNHHCEPNAFLKISGPVREVMHGPSSSW